MSTHSVRGHSPRSHERRDAALDIDLNMDPPGADQEQEGPSIPSGSHGVQAVQQPQFMQPIDVEAIDDEVIETTRSAFVEVLMDGNVSHLFSTQLRDVWLKCLPTVSEDSKKFIIVFHVSTRKEIAILRGSKI